MTTQHTPGPWHGSELLRLQARLDDANREYESAARAAKARDQIWSWDMSVAVQHIADACAAIAKVEDNT